MVERVLVPVYLPAWLYQGLRRMRRAVLPLPSDTSGVPYQDWTWSAEGVRDAAGINLWGERHVEWTFISERMPNGPGEALDFGCEHGYLSLLAAMKGFRVTGVDLEEQEFPWQHPSFRFVRGDLLELEWPRNSLDLIVNCSSVEHVGLAGRYGQRQTESDGDLRAMRKFFGLLKPGGMLLMTAPCGQDAIFAPLHRVYGTGRLPKLIGSFEVKEEVYWEKNKANHWVASEKRTALSVKPSADPANPYNSVYALGCFVLRKPADGQARN